MDRNPTKGDGSMTLNDQARSEMIQLMEDQGLNRVQLAEKLGVTKGYVTNLLRPGRNLTLDAVEKVADVLGATGEIKLRWTEQ